MEDLLLSEKFDRYEAFLTCIKRWLMNWTEAHAPPKGRFELYKFTGDGWILLFPDTIRGEHLVAFLHNLCEMVKAELARHIVPNLSTMPAVLGATLGVEAGHLVRMTMNEREEYVGRALNVACRLQDAAKDKETAHPDCYKVLVSARFYNERLAKASTRYKVDETTCSLRNILGEGDLPAARSISPRTPRGSLCHGQRMRRPDGRARARIGKVRRNERQASRPLPLRRRAP